MLHMLLQHLELGQCLVDARQLMLINWWALSTSTGPDACVLGHSTEDMARAGQQLKRLAGGPFLLQDSVISQVLRAIWTQKHRLLPAPQFSHYKEDGDSCVSPYSLMAASWNCFQKDFWSCLKKNPWSKELMLIRYLSCTWSYSKYSLCINLFYTCYNSKSWILVTSTF